jgi:octaprenyl-diphosphate synthase
MTTTTTLPDEAAPQIEATLALGLRLVEERLLEWSRSPVTFLQEGSHRILQAGGKRFRPTFCLLSYLANGGAPFNRDVLDSAAIMELVHTATLVHDDILDDADTRRGQPSAHRQYGTSRALLLGDHLFTAAFQPVARLPRPVQEVLTHASRLLAEGEAQELELTRAGTATLEDYFLVIAKKTASLIEAATSAGALCARADGPSVEPLAEFGFHSGIAFQLVDDLLDVEGVTEITGKPARWDLSRGVPNAAVLATLEADLRGKPTAVRLPRGMQEELDAVLQRMAEVRGDERVRRLARMYGARALEALGRVPPTRAAQYLAAQVESSLVRLK